MVWTDTNPLQRLNINGLQGIKTTRLKEILPPVVGMVYKDFVPSIVHE